MPSTEGVQINFRVSETLHRSLSAMAAKAGMRASSYAGTLFHAAYAARTKPPTGDADLDTAVGMVAVLWAEHRDEATIAAVLGLSPKTVSKIIKAWQKHHIDHTEGTGRG